MPGVRPLHRFVVVLSIDFDDVPPTLDARLRDTEAMLTADERVLSATVAVRQTALAPVVEVALELHAADDLAAVAITGELRDRLHERVLSRLLASITCGRPRPRGRSS